MTDKKPDITFTAANYREEYLRLKRDFHGEANSIKAYMTDHYLDEYIEKIRAEKHKGWRSFGIKHEGLVVGGLLMGVGGGFVAAIGGIMTTLLTAGAVAPVALPIAGAGIVSIFATPKIGRALHSAPKLARKQIEEDLESGVLIARYINALKRYERPVPPTLAVFDDKNMRKNHTPIIEITAATVPPMSLLTGAFSGETAEKETKPAALPPPAPKKDPKP